jgi:hypothetical protein
VDDTAYTDGIKRFSGAKKYTAYAGLAPWVQNSNETVHHGKITKRGPEELRTALVQVVMRIRRKKRKTLGWRLMERYEALKKSKGSGKSIIATARKVAVIIWHMLNEGKEFDAALMVERKLARKADSMSKAASPRVGSVSMENRPSKRGKKNGDTKKTGVTGKKRNKPANGFSQVDFL